MIYTFKDGTENKENYPDYRMKPTGRENAAGEVEVILLGIDFGEGYQRRKEGSIIWVKKDLLAQE